MTGAITNRMWKGLVIVATAGLIGDTFLHWIATDNFWKADNSLHMKVAICAAVVIAAVLCLFTLAGRTAFDWLAGAVALFAGGGVVMWALFVSSFHPHIGAWLAVGLGAAIAVGGLLIEYPAVGHAAARAPAVPEPTAATALQPTPATAPQPTAATASQPTAAQPTVAADTAMAPPRPSDLTEPITTNVPPGWYPDPSGEHAERLWDGSVWTHEVR